MFLATHSIKFTARSYSLTQDAEDVRRRRTAMAGQALGIIFSFAGQSANEKLRCFILYRVTAQVTVANWVKASKSKWLFIR